MVLNIDRFVIKSEKFLYGEAENNKHIAFTVTENYVCYSGVALTSIMRVSRDNNYTFHIFSKRFKKDDIDKIEKTAERFNVNVVIYYVNENIFINCKEPGVYTYASYYRCIIPKFFSGMISRLLYLDVDVCALEDISSLWEIDISNKIVAAVKGKDNEGAKIGVKDYFLSGGLFINILRWNNNSISEKCLEKIKEDKIYRCPDQDILNLVLENNVLLIDKKYNFHYSLSYLLDSSKKPSEEECPQNILIIHFAGHSKPWHSWVKTMKAASKYIDVKNHSAWKDMKLIKPQHYKDFHKVARLAKKESTILDIIICYMRYIMAKVNYIIKMGE